MNIIRELLFEKLNEALHDVGNRFPAAPLVKDTRNLPGLPVTRSVRLWSLYLFIPVRSNRDVIRRRYSEDLSKNGLCSQKPR